MSNTDIFGFAGTMRHDGAIAGMLGKQDCVDSLGEGADLVGLDQNRIGAFLGDAALQELDIGDKQIIANQLDAVTQTLGEDFPVGPIVLGKAVFDRNYGVVVDNPSIPVNEVVGRLPVAVGFQDIMILIVKFRGGDVHGDADIFAELVVSFIDGILDAFEWLVVAITNARSIATLVANSGGVVALFQDILQGMKNLGAHTNSIGDVASAGRDNHVFLEVGRPGGMLAAVHDIHHGHRDGHFISGAGKLSDVLIKWHLAGASVGLGGGEGNGENSIGAEAGFILGTIKIAHDLVDVA